MSYCPTPKDCRISRSASYSTCIGYTPIYDGFGNEIGEDPNVTTYSESCATCGKSWTIRTQGRKCSRIEVSATPEREGG